MPSDGVHRCLMASGLPLDKPLIATIEQHAKILCNQRKAATQSTITIKEVRRSNDVADTVRLFFNPKKHRQCC